MSSFCVTWSTEVKTTSQQENVLEIGVPAAKESTAVETAVCSSLPVSGIVAATNILEQCASRSHEPTECLVVVDIHMPEKHDDVANETTPQSLFDSEHSQSVVCDNIDSDDAVTSSSPSLPRRVIGRVLSRLAVLGRLQSAGRKKEETERWTSECSRRVAIESSLSVNYRSLNRRRHRPVTTDSCDVDEDDERTIQHFATSLTKTDIIDGRFTSRLPVDVIPHGEVIIRMRNGRLEVLKNEMNEHHVLRRLCGVIELPIFVDTDSVTVRHDPLQHCLVIEATTKGCLRRRSVSLDELRWLRGRKVARNFAVFLMPPWKRHTHDATVVLCSETRAVTDSSDDSSND